MLNCASTPMKVELVMTVMNPDGEHLGYGFIPLPIIYMLLLSVWVVGTSMWCFNWIKHRTQTIRLNSALSIYPVTKIVFAAIAILYWKTISLQGEAPYSYLLTYGFLYISAEAVFYLVLMLVATGWGLLKDNLGMDKYLITGVIVTLIGTRLLGFLLHGLFFLLSYIIYIVIVVIVFRYINKNVQDLQVELRNNPRPVGDSDQRNRDLNSSKDKMIYYKVIMLAYVALVMLSALFELLFLRDYPWIAEMMRELLELSIFLCVGYVLRLRSLDRYYRVDVQNEPAYFNQPVELQPMPLEHERL